MSEKSDPTLVFPISQWLEIDRDNLVEDTLTKINSFLRVKIIEADLNNIYTIGKSENLPFVLEFVSFLDKFLIFKNTKKLKGTGVSISNDLSKEDREDQKVLLNHLTTKSTRQEDPNAKIQGFELVVGENKYTAGDLIEQREKAGIPQQNPERRKEEEEEDHIQSKRTEYDHWTTGANRNLRNRNK
ncbi:hypothetical protein JTB14_033891 [Gonioctena quinquepunctata]|nr:hypothetical protein JTB14_033891 [Gonioctena quinquepunctata]